MCFAAPHGKSTPRRFYTLPIIGADSQVAVGAAAEPSGCLPRRSNSRPKQTGGRYLSGALGLAPKTAIQIQHAVLPLSDRIIILK